MNSRKPMNDRANSAELNVFRNEIEKEWNDCQFDLIQFIQVIQLLTPRKFRRKFHRKEYALEELMRVLSVMRRQILSNLDSGQLSIQGAQAIKMVTEKLLEGIFRHDSQNLENDIKDFDRETARLQYVSVNDEIKRYVTIAHYGDELDTGREQLSLANPSLDTPENFDRLIAHAADADKIRQGLQQLSWANPRLDTQANFDRLIAHAADAYKLGLGIKQLSRAIPRLNAEENISILIQYRDFIDRFLVEIQSQEHFNQIKNSIDNEVKERNLAFLTSIYRRRSPDNETYRDVTIPKVIRFFQPRLEPAKDVANKIFDYLPRIRGFGSR